LFIGLAENIVTLLLEPTITSKTETSVFSYHHWFKKKTS